MTSRVARPPLALLVATLLLGGAAAHAGPHDFVAYLPGMGGSSQQAQPFLDGFLRVIEKSQGWKAGSAVGMYFEDAAQAQAYIKTQKPGFGMLAPGVSLDLSCQKEVEPVVAVVGIMSTSSAKYHVIAKDPALKDLAGLQGKKLSSNHLQNPKFVSRVIFDGKIDVAKHFSLQPTRSPVGPFKALDQGKADAALIDDAQLAAMAKLPFAAQLHVVFSTPAMPPFPLVAWKVVSATEREAMRKSLVGLCAANAAVCKSLQITSFDALDAKAYSAAVQQYCKP